LKEVSAGHKLTIAVYNVVVEGSGQEGKRLESRAQHTHSTG
jgi:hypothetical protein